MIYCVADRSTCEDARCLREVGNHSRWLRLLYSCSRIEEGGFALVTSSMPEVEGVKGVYAHLELLAWPIVIGYLVEAHRK